MYKKKATAISLPQSKTAKIMSSAVGVDFVSADIVALATKATEIFLEDLARRAYDQSSNEEFRSDVLEYDDIQKLVHNDPRYDFLIDTTPKRIKFSEALKLVDEANKRKEEQALLNPDKFEPLKPHKKKSKAPKVEEKKEQELTPEEGEDLEAVDEEEPGVEDEGNHNESQDEENEGENVDENHGE